MFGCDLKTGGESGIRTHVTLSSKHAFQACAFSHSAISPLCENQDLGRSLDYVQKPWSGATFDKAARQSAAAYSAMIVRSVGSNRNPASKNGGTVWFALAVFVIATFRAPGGAREETKPRLRAPW